MDFEINEDVTTYSGEEIADLITQGNEALDALFALENPTPADVEQAERISAALDTLNGEKDSRASAAERMSTLRNSRSVEASAEDTDGEGEDENDDLGDEGEDTEDDLGGDDDASIEAGTDQEDTVTAAGSATRSARQRLSNTRPRPPANTDAISITAAADVPGFATGSDIADMTAVAEAVLNRSRSFPSFHGPVDGAAMQRYGVAQFRRQFDDHLVAGGQGSDDDQVVLDRAANEFDLPGGNLIAAGGWCAPSETLYDFCAGETTDGLIDLPEINVKRGGIRFTPGPDFADLYGNGFSQTEAQAIAGTTKSCYEIECPSFDEVRLDAKGLCIKVPLLTNAGYPELVRRVISGSLIAHQHTISAGLIGGMVTAAGAAVVINSVGGSVADTLNAVELVVAQTRQDYRLSLSATLEVVLPQWVKGVFRADLANRNGVDMLAVTDAQINSYFAVRGARIQWVYNWQDLTVDEEGYPATFNFLAYPAGTFVKGTANVINLDAVYDAASLTENTYTGLFFEEGVLLAQRCYRAKVYTITTCAGGVTGAASNEACFTLTP